MDFAPVKKWAIFFIGILSAIVIADALSNVIVSATGMVGWMKFLVSFVLYAVFFFAILYALEKIFHIEFFGFWREWKKGYLEMFKKTWTITGVLPLPLRLPKNAITPEQVMRNHRHQ